MRHPIRRQLLIPLLTALVTAVLSTALLAAWLSMSRSLTELRQRQEEVISVLQNARFPLTGPILEQMSRLSRHHFLLWDSRQKRFTDSSFALDSKEMNSKASQLGTLMPGGPFTESVSFNGVDYTVRVAHLSWQPQFYILVLTSNATLSQVRWTAVSPPLAVGGGTLLLLIPWLLALTSNWSRRIGTIQKQVADVARGQHVSFTGTKQRDDELAALMANIVKMDQRLQELQSENLQLERERLMAQLAAGFAHQFRNGVAGVSLAIQLHSSRCSSPADGSLSVALKQLALLEAEIRGILSLGKRSNDPKGKLLLNSLVDDAVELVTPSIQHQHIQLDRVQAETTIEVVGARDGLLSALINLLLNAIDAAGPRGKIKVSTRDSTNSVSILVQDNGPGPRPEIAQKMMAPFVTSKPDGVGLGLAIVSEVARAHHGQLDWHRDSEWTTMELSLPKESVNTTVSEQQ